MSFVDREIVCLDCTQSFVFTAGEQEFYERKGFKEEPKRCKPCREARKQRRSDTPVTPRPARPAMAANANGFGFGGDQHEADAQDNSDSLGNRAYSDDAEGDDSIGNRVNGHAPSPARPRATAPRGERNGGRGAAPVDDRRELHDATCAQCNGVARVPFKPVPGRPVYCRDCYASRAASAGGR